MKNFLYSIEEKIKKCLFLAIDSIADRYTITYPISFNLESMDIYKLIISRIELYKTFLNHLKFLPI